MDPITITGAWIGNTSQTLSTIDCTVDGRSNLNVTPSVPKSNQVMADIISTSTNYVAPYTILQLSRNAGYVESWIKNRLSGVAYRWEHIHDFGNLVDDVQELTVTIWNGHDEDLPITIDFVPMQHAIQVASYVPNSIPPKRHITVVLRIFRTIGTVMDTNYNVIFRTGNNEVLPINLKFHRDEPGLINLGVLVVDTTVDFALWNPHTTPTTFTVDLPSSTYGLECLLDENITIAPYEYEMIPVKVFSKAGAPEVTDMDALIVRSSHGDVVSVGTKLIRAVVMTIPPDWSKGITERIEYLTKIFISYDGREQRVDLRMIPRQQWVYDIITMSEEEAALHDSLFWAGTGRRMILPLWTDSRQLKLPITPDSLTFNIDTTYGDFGIDEYVLIFKDPFTWEIAPIETFTTTSITLKRPILNLWEEGVEIIPTKSVRVIEQISFRDETRSIQSTSVTFEKEV